MFDFYLSNKHLKQYLTPKEILKFRFLNFINTLAVKRSDYIIVPSCSVKKEVEEKFFGKSDKVKVTELASENTAAIAKALDDKTEFVRFGTVAGFYPHKGHLKVLQLANTFRKVGFTHFRFYFRGSHVYKNYVEEIRAKIKELQLEDFIVFEPYEPNTTLRTIYEKYDVVVLLPEYEGFGLPVLEAQANSSVVVCSDIPVLREVLGESAMYLDMNSLENEAEELVQKLNSRHHLDQLVIAGKKNVQRFSWSKTGELTLKVYQSAIC
jgi:glycosyltransferase involved in cell wall biosynthesis